MFKRVVVTTAVIYNTTISSGETRLLVLQRAVSQLCARDAIATSHAAEEAGLYVTVLGTSMQERVWLARDMPHTP